MLTAISENNLLQTKESGNFKIIDIDYNFVAQLDIDIDD